MAKKVSNWSFHLHTGDSDILTQTRGKDGGFYIRINQRDGGKPVRAAVLSGHVEDGKLYLRVGIHDKACISYSSSRHPQLVDESTGPVTAEFYTER